MKVLVTGGAGYIGSHTCAELIRRGNEVVIADNFSNSSVHVLARLESLAASPVPRVELDLRDGAGLAELFSRHRFDAVVHFAALKSVSESCERPVDYFDNNIGGTISLLQAMTRAGVRRLVFSSSATVYGNAALVPVREDAPLQVTNPYGRSKLVCEQLIEDCCASGAGLVSANLRYFNPVGAHPSGLMGEDPRGMPSNLMPYVSQVAAGRRPQLRIFGGDYATPDGTGVRDFLHVMDLARAHADALDYLQGAQSSVTLNLGTGKGVSVLDLVGAFERVSGRKVPYEIVARRIGDVACLYADPSLAQRLFGWRAELDLDAMCRDAWRWQSENPDGFSADQAILPSSPSAELINR